MSINKNQLKKLIIETLCSIDMHSESAVNLLMGTAAQESHLGTYIKQVKGPALGIFQMEPVTHDDIWDNYLKYKKGLIKTIRATGVYDHNAEALVYNLKYSIIMTRLHYLRVKRALPEHDDVEGLALYWKKFYNTYLGAGTIEEFINNYNTYVK